MTIDPQWQLLKAAESALRVLSDAEDVLHDLYEASLGDECEAAAGFLRDAIAAVKSANMCQADEVPAAVSSSLPAVALQSDSQWSPIKTAPKDGTPVILAITGGKNGPAIGEVRWWDSDGGDWWWAGNGPGDYHGGPISEIQFGMPTHWMPMPEAPVANPSESSEERSDDE